MKDFHAPDDYNFEAAVTEDERIEGKLTGQITSKHSVVASYLDRTTTQEGNIFGTIVDLASLDNRELPNTLLAVSYNGILTSNVLVEAQYSAREFAFVELRMGGRRRVRRQTLGIAKVIGNTHDL